MILLINVCREKLHYYEFVKPVERVLIEAKENYFIRHYGEIKEEDLKRAKKIIICGTSLADNDFVRDIEFFYWLKDFKRAVFGICAGMQIIGSMKKIRKSSEIGFYFEEFKKEFLGLKGKVEVYHLHNNFVDFERLDEFEVFAKSEEGIVQAVKHKGKNLYGVLFHPEVRNKEMILEFVKNG